MRSRMGQRYPNDWSEGELQEIADDLEYAVTIPVDVKIEAEHRVLDISQMEEIIRGAGRIVLQDCSCKMDRGNCDAPVDVCISIDEAADYEMEDNRHNAREATLEEAMDALHRSHEAGLVHMAYTMKGNDRPTVICSCCPCCCHTLGGLLRFGISTEVLTSKLITEIDREKCNNSGICVDRCVFMAREMTNGEVQYDPSKCLGCGLCVNTCPTGAISLVPRA